VDMPQGPPCWQKEIAVSDDQYDDCSDTIAVYGQFHRPAA
jgi:hypothetical protein